MSALPATLGISRYAFSPSCCRSGATFAPLNPNSVLFWRTFFRLCWQTPSHNFAHGPWSCWQTSLCLPCNFFSLGLLALGTGNCCSATRVAFTARPLSEQGLPQTILCVAPLTDTPAFNMGWGTTTMPCLISGILNIARPLPCKPVLLKRMTGIVKMTKTTQTATSKGVDCWIRGKDGKHGNDENHGNPGCKTKVPQTWDLG